MEYHKIYSVFDRDPATNYKTLIEGQWSKPVFGYLASNQWEWTEKIDGTNIRIIWDGEKVRFGGKTDNAQLYAPLVAILQEKFYAGALTDVCKGPVVMFGEGCGAGIQKGGAKYKPDGPMFVGFDILAGDNTWLSREIVAEIFGALEVQMTPVLGAGTLMEAVEFVKAGPVSEFSNMTPEGVVVRPLGLELKDGRGNRVIAKIKCADFIG